jgi:hypothetical protein
MKITRAIITLIHSGTFLAWISGVSPKGRLLFGRRLVMSFVTHLGIVFIPRIESKNVLSIFKV